MALQLILFVTRQYVCKYDYKYLHTYIYILIWPVFLLFRFEIIILLLGFLVTVLMAALATWLVMVMEIVVGVWVGNIYIYITYVSRIFIYVNYVYEFWL